MHYFCSQEQTKQSNNKARGTVLVWVLGQILGSLKRSYVLLHPL